MLKWVLVTGGAGFIGSHLCHKLIAAGHHVRCLDNLYTGDKANIADLMSLPAFDFLEADVNDPIDLDDISHIYHLACPASPYHYQKDPIYTLKTAVIGTMNMLDLAVRTGARILQASTSEVYGDPKVDPQPESYWGNVNCFGIRSCYDEGKRCAETLCHDYVTTRSVDVKLVRIFNTYGPNMQPDDGRVISNFIVQALAGKNITIHGDGLQSRSFCYVDDMVRALVKVMAMPPEFHGPVNLGNPQPITILELANKVLQLSGSRSELDFLPFPADDPYLRCPDIRLARQQLAWEPVVGLDEGLCNTIEYFRNASTSKCR